MRVEHVIVALLITLVVVFILLTISSGIFPAFKAGMESLFKNIG